MGKDLFTSAGVGERITDAIADLPISAGQMHRQDEERQRAIPKTRLSDDFTVPELIFPCNHCDYSRECPHNGKPQKEGNSGADCKYYLTWRQAEGGKRR